MAQRVVLAMSGGVDSSTAALLLRDAGYEVIGLFMRSGATEAETCSVNSPLPVIEAQGSHKQGCCSASDAADARRVADQLEIPFHSVNFEEGFGRIKDYFVKEYLSGRTPNPCVQCNAWLKFGKLWDFAQRVGAEFIATGHYAQIRHIPGESVPALVKGHDLTKDQSYALFGLSREVLPHVLFPVGGLTKVQIRERAGQAGLRVAHKPDSQEICFVPDHDYAGFIRKYQGDVDTSGELVSPTEEVLGEHTGYEQFTIGQRKGLGVTFGEPRYVVKVDATTRRVVIGTRDDLARTELEADQLNWLVEDLPATFRCRAKIRYLHRGADAEVERIDQDRIRIRFDAPEYGVAPGQAVVVYADDRVLGGGWIL